MTESQFLEEAQKALSGTAAGIAMNPSTYRELVRHMPIRTSHYRTNIFAVPIALDPDMEDSQWRAYADRKAWSAYLNDLSNRTEGR